MPNDGNGANAVIARDVSVVVGGKYVAINKISAEIPRGRVVGIIGPSGAGKTTFIRSIVGRQRISGGYLKVLGIKAGSAELRHQVSYMTQELSVYADLTVKENLSYFARMVGVAKSETKSEVNRLLKTVDLGSQADTLVMNLSGGQKQRVSLAIAMIGDPVLLVLDEPTVGLDPVLRDSLWELFRQLAEAGRTLIISSHVMDEAERCDQLLLLRDAEVLAQGSPRDLRNRTGTNTVEQAFLKLVGDSQ